MISNNSEINFEKAKELIENGERLKSFREKVKALQTEWQNIFSSKIPKYKVKRKTKEKLKRGLRTPESDFFLPILQSLIELGGKAKMKDVLQKVYDKMKNKLNTYDLQSLSSDAKSKRWQNTAQWARNTMVNEGLLKSDSPWGIWEITDKGRRYLESK